MLGTLSTYVGGLRSKIYILCFHRIMNVSEKQSAAIIVHMEYTSSGLYTQFV